MAQPVVNFSEWKIVKLAQRYCRKCGVTPDENYIYECGSCVCKVCKGEFRCLEHYCDYCRYCNKCYGYHCSETAGNGHYYNDECNCGEDFICDCFDGPEDLISFQLGDQKPTPSNLFPFINRFIDKHPLYSKRILMGGACRWALKESQKTSKLTSLLDSGVDYWKRKFHGFHSKEMKEIVFILLLIYRRSCTRTNTLQLPYISEEIWLLFPQCLRSADVTKNPFIKF